MATENKQNQKPSSIFDLPSGFFDCAFILRSHATNSDCKVALDPEIPSNMEGTHREEEEKQGGQGQDMSRWTCNTCRVEFSSLEEQRSHFKSDFHRFNVKWRMNGRDPLKEEEFEEVAQGTFSKEDDISSISGSDEELDEPVNSGREPLSESMNEVTSMKSQLSISLQSGEVVSIWRSLILGDKENLSLDDKSSAAKENDGKDLCLTDEEVFRRLRSLVQESRDQKNLRVVLLASGGHFAGCVFDGNAIVAHKTHHRYVVRAKAGGRQSTKDATGRAPKSAGASLRRHNEMALKKEILELLAAWKCYVDAALCIYIYSPSSNGQMFFGGENPPLNSRDIRVRRIPLTTRRPTFKEAKRIYHQLTSVYPAERIQVDVRNKVEELEVNLKTDKDNQKEECQTRGSSKNGRKRGNAPGVCSDLDHLNDLSISDTSDVINTSVMVNQSTPLHEAAKSGNATRTSELLEQQYNPCIKDERGRTPYVVAADKETRNVFRRFMAANPDKWDWHAASIPSPLTEEMEITQAAKQAEKDAKRKAKVKEMKKLRKAKEKAQAQSISSQVASVAVCHGQDAVPQLLQKGKALPNMQSQAFQEDLKKAQAIEREKRAAAAEKRISSLSNHSENIAATAPRSVESRGTSSEICCSCCATSLAGKIPFHRYNYKYCSTSCMHVHREVLEDG